ncbi:MAG: DMT family transporter [Acidimicrobiia bacterium]|nr:DMT family transporter [Acidimicrobiia bacterium]
MTRLTALTGVIGISFAAIFVRLADASPTTVTFFRLVYALPFLAVIVAMSPTTDDRPLRARAIAFAAGFVFTVDLTMWHASIGMIGAGLATVLVNVQVVVVAMISWLVARERPTPVAAATIPVILGGIVLIAGVGEAPTTDDPLTGTLLGVGAAVAYGSFIVLLRTANRLGTAHPAAPLLDATLGGAIAALAWSFVETDFAFAPSWPSHGWLLLLAIVGQTVGWLLLSRALPRLPALETSLLILVQPAATLLWARLFFDERLAVGQWIGVVVVLVGVAVAAGRTTAVTRPRGATSGST